MRPSLLPKLSALLALGFLAAGCTALPKRQAKVVPAPTPARKSNYWEGDGVQGAPRIVIALGEQRAYFYKGERVVGETSISSGRKGFETPAGEYKVIQKDPTHVSTLYGDFVDDEGTVVKSNVDVSKEPPLEGQTFRGAKMPNFLRFHEGYGLHAGRLPGYRASHGCIRLPREMSQHFFESASVGTPVVVRD